MLRFYGRIVNILWYLVLIWTGLLLHVIRMPRPTFTIIQTVAKLANGAITSTPENFSWWNFDFIGVIVL